MLKTLCHSVSFKGIGLHGGQPAKITISPAPAGYGLNFRRSDVEPHQQMIPARYDLVSDTTLCTKLTNEYGVSVGTVEHVLAALAGCGVNDALISIDGPEVPIMDGSSSAFVEGIIRSGIVVRDRACKAIRILEPVRVVDGGRSAELRPAPHFSMSFSISFEDPAIGDQSYDASLMNGTFVEELSDCRTFGHLREVEHLRKLGLARGGSLENAIVVSNGSVLNADGLRGPIEFVRHKMLDAVGDLALAGFPIIGSYHGVRSGHEMTNRLLHLLFERTSSWMWDELPVERALGWGVVPMTRAEAPSAMAIG